jgi:hypothetical protein
VNIFKVSPSPYPSPLKGEGTQPDLSPRMIQALPQGRGALGKEFTGYIFAFLFSFRNELSVKRIDSSNPIFGSQLKSFLAFSMLGLRV